MDHEWMIMRTGAGRYIQGENTSSLVGQELKRLGFHKVGIIAGKRAFEAAKQPLITGLDQAGLVYDVSIYPGSVSYTHLRAHETGRNLVCRLLLEKKKQNKLSLIHISKPNRNGYR